MEEKTKGSLLSHPDRTLDKDTSSNIIIQQVRKIFLSGREVTAKELNSELCFNDARKVISTLRNKEGWNIKDERLDSGCKLYWLEKGGDK